MLFIDALGRTAEPTMPFIIVIDALDERGGSQEKLIDGLIDIMKATSWIKFFITSRRYEAIETCLDKAGAIRHKIEIIDAIK